LRPSWAAISMVLAMVLAVLLGSATTATAAESVPVASPVAVVQVAPSGVMVPSDEIDDAVASFLGAGGAGMTCKEVSRGAASTASPAYAVAAAGICGVGLGYYAGKGTIRFICWGSRMRFNYPAKAEVWAMTFGRYTQC